MLKNVCTIIALCFLGLALTSLVSLINGIEEIKKLHELQICNSAKSWEYVMFPFIEFFVLGFFVILLVKIANRRKRKKVFPLNERI